MCVVCVFMAVHGKSTFTFIPYKSNRLVFVEHTVAGPLLIQQLKLQTVMYNHLRISDWFGKADCSITLLTFLSLFVAFKPSMSPCNICRQKSTMFAWILVKLHITLLDEIIRHYQDNNLHFYGHKMTSDTYIMKRICSCIDTVSKQTGDSFNKKVNNWFFKN